MNKPLVGSLLALGIAMGIAPPAALAADIKMNVQVKAASVRETPSFLGKLLASLNYGDAVVVIEKPGDWMKVRTANAAAITGWMHKSSLTTKAVALKSGAQAANVSASSEELALAGRGFDDEIERAYKARHGDLSAAFAKVDQIEKSNVVSPQQAAAFLAEGGVKPTEGSAK